MLRLDDGGYGLLVSAWGLGLLLATVLVGRMGHRYELGRMFILGIASDRSALWLELLVMAAALLPLLTGSRRHSRLDRLMPTASA